MTDKPQPREPLIGWMILEDHTDDLSQWDGVISYPDPTGANLAWLDPVKMIEHSAYAAVCKEQDELKVELERYKQAFKFLRQNYLIESARQEAQDILEGKDI